MSALEGITIHTITSSLLYQTEGSLYILTGESRFNPPLQKKSHMAPHCQRDWHDKVK